MVLERNGSCIPLQAASASSRMISSLTAWKQWQAKISGEYVESVLCLALELAYHNLMSIIGVNRRPKCGPGSQDSVGTYHM